MDVSKKSDSPHMQIRYGAMLQGMTQVAGLSSAAKMAHVIWPLLNSFEYFVVLRHDICYERFLWEDMRGNFAYQRYYRRVEICKNVKRFINGMYEIVG